MGASESAVALPVPLSAVMGPGAHHQGDLSFEGRVRVDGTFTGRLYTEDVLEVGADGLVDGEADVASAIVAGTVKGRLRVREHLLIQAGGAVLGLLDAGIVELQPGGRIEGEVRILGVELP